MSNALTTCCKVPTCTREHYRDGWCWAHWDVGRHDGHKSRYRPVKRLPDFYRKATG